MPDRPVVLVAHGGLIAALTAALLDLPVDNWPVLGGMGNASWVQLSGHSATTRRRAGRSGGGSTCGTPRPRSPTMSSESHRTGRRTTLLVFADSLSYYGPTGGLPADDPRIWPNIVAAQLGWDLELIGRIGWTCRDVWWAATQDPRSWAALPRAGAVIFATGGMDSLPSPLPTALRELIRYVRPPWLRRWVRDGYGWLQPRLSPVARPGAAAAPDRRIPRNDPRRNRFQPAGHPGGGVAASRCTSPTPTARPTAAGAGTVAAITEWAGEHDVPLVDLKAAVAEQIYGGRGNPDGIHWNFEAHRGRRRV